MAASGMTALELLESDRRRSEESLKIQEIEGKTDRVELRNGGSQQVGEGRDAAVPDPIEGKGGGKLAIKRRREEDEEESGDEKEDEEVQTRGGKQARITPDRLFGDSLADAAALLAKSWGYRAAENNDHSAFEDKTHAHEFRALQTYTDLVFRNAWNIGNYPNLDNLDMLFEGDIYPMKRTMYTDLEYVGLGVMDETTRNKWADLLEDFFKPGSEGDVLANRFAEELEAGITVAKRNTDDGAEKLGIILSGLNILRNFRTKPPITREVLDEYF